MANLKEIRIRMASVESTQKITSAMKMVSARQYKNDLSDIVGIIGEHQRRGLPLTYAQIDRAVKELYGSWDLIDTDTKQLLEKVLSLPDVSAVYEEYRNAEIEAKDLTDLLSNCMIDRKSTRLNSSH